MAPCKRAVQTLSVIALVLYFSWVFRGNLGRQPAQYTSFLTRTRDEGSCDILYENGATGFYSESLVEQKQLDMYFRFVLSNKTCPPEAYKHSVEVACSTNQPQSGTVLWIEERCFGKLTAGGSSFRILFGSPVQQVCTYDDYFNGTYIVFCPAPLHGCIDVSIDIRYVDFDAFRGNRVPLNTPLWNDTLCPVGNGQCRLVHSTAGKVIDRTALPDVISLRRRVAAENRFKWSKMDGKLRLMAYTSDVPNKTPHVFHPINQSELCSCLRRFKNVVMIGDSHMRYKFDYLVMQCRRAMPLLQRKHDSSRVDNLRYIYVVYLQEYARVWRKYLNPLKLTTADVVLIQTGSWDLAFNPLHDVMNINIAQFRTGLKTIRDGLARSRTPLFLITEPPFRDLCCRECHGKRGYKNNVAITALSAEIVSTATKLGIPVHDEFNLLLPRQSETVCGGHYLCRTASNSAKVTGPAGIASIELLTKCLCSR